VSQGNSFLMKHYLPVLSWRKAQGCFKSKLQRRQGNHYLKMQQRMW